MSKISNIETTFYPIEGENFKPFEFTDVVLFVTEFNPNSKLLLVAVFLRESPDCGFYVGSRFISAYIDFTNQLFQQVQIFQQFQPTNSNATNK